MKASLLDWRTVLLRSNWICNTEWTGRAMEKANRFKFISILTFTLTSCWWLLYNFAISGILCTWVTSLSIMDVWSVGMILWPVTGWGGPRTASWKRCVYNTLGLVCSIQSYRDEEKRLKTKTIHSRDFLGCSHLLLEDFSSKYIKE